MLMYALLRDATLYSGSASADRLVVCPECRDLTAQIPVVSIDVGNDDLAGYGCGINIMRQIVGIDDGRYIFITESQTGNSFRACFYRKPALGFKAADKNHTCRNTLVHLGEQKVVDLPVIVGCKISLDQVNDLCKLVEDDVLYSFSHSGSPVM